MPSPSTASPLPYYPRTRLPSEAKNLRTNTHCVVTMDAMASSSRGIAAIPIYIYAGNPIYINMPPWISQSQGCGSRGWLSQPQVKIEQIAVALIISPYMKY